MNKMLKICCMIFIVAAANFAVAKVDPATGASSDGTNSPTLSNADFNLLMADRARMEQQLEALYQEAYARKLVEQNADQIWAEIDQLNSILYPAQDNPRVNNGGETCAEAGVITSIPYCDEGSTANHTNDYHPNEGERCGPDPDGEPVQGEGPEVVYTYTPEEDIVVSISLCGSGYDTYLYIYEGGCPGSGEETLVCCSDDHSGSCPGGSGSLTSCCNDLELLAGHTYYIFVDGWRNTSAGDYNLSITNGIRCERCTVPPPTCIECPPNGYQSIEPVCENGYVDNINAGCVPGTPGFFEEVQCNTTICGTLGQYFNPNGAPVIDQDYYIFTVTSDAESLFVRVKSDANGFWAMWRVNPLDICGNDAVEVVPTQGFERCQERSFLQCVQPGTYVVGITSVGGVPCGAPYRIDITCLDCPELMGRCCYRTEDGGQCAETTREECADLQGLWTLGATCEECCPTDFCVDYIDIPGVYEYTHTANTCCSVPVDFCVGENGCGVENCYDAVRAVIYRIVLESDAIVSLSVSGPLDNQLMIFTDCLDPTGSCVASADNGTVPGFIGAPETLEDVSLPAGTYYIATSNFFWANAPCGPITLHIISDTPLPVEMIDFDAVALDRSVKLSWSTASESNSSHFDILRDGQLVNRVTAVNSATGSNYSWTDSGLDNGRLYQYTLIAADLNGAEAVAARSEATPNGNAATVSEFALYQNYPNPFNPETQIAFNLPQAASVRLSVVNALGQEVAVVAEGNHAAGRHNVTFDGDALPSGLYFYHLVAGDYTQIRKMVLLK